MIKAAFFDIDGTLLSHRSKQVPPSARSAINRLRERGILCVAATGRQISEMEKLPSADIPFDALITLNGQMVLDSKGELLYAAELGGEAKRYLVRAFEERLFPVTMVERNRIYVNYVNDLVREVHASISSGVPPVDEYRERPIFQVCTYLDEDEKYLLEPILGECVATRWHFGGYDIIAKGGGKVTGIRKYLELTGLKQEEIIAFGDGENDVEMLGYAGIGVCMGNGVDVAKAAADYVTADIDDDGIEKALKHFGLI